MDYARLIDEHDAIDIAAEQLVDLASSEHPRPADASAALDDLATLLADHLRGEDRMLYPTILKARARGDLAPGQDMAADLEALTQDWTRYLSEWSPDRVAADWREFHADTVAMLRRLRARVRRETDLLYPLALKHAVIRLRPDRAHSVAG